MYGPLWRALPGPAWLKAIIVLAVLVGLFFLLMNVVFPWVEAMVPWTDVAVE
ncbi:hypothetical protein ACLB3A_03625 [Corynebacterium freneyi]|uniref:Membrane protein n=1 Tax=Corynebacterium freneyi DNF00450 TaxID=1287475 RepID=A0A095ZH99_9CORY|nr:hypothetical protein [Corynebacterium freneyi]KGF18042.1 membrane protein [Corynebacterium freneyi DNF00450]MDK8768176.1 hypothetical protein [Corynebacterium freneyi]